SVDFEAKDPGAARRLPVVAELATANDALGIQRSEPEEIAVSRAEADVGADVEAGPVVQFDGRSRLGVHGTSRQVCGACRGRREYSRAKRDAGHCILRILEHCWPLPTFCCPNPPQPYRETAVTQGERSGTFRFQSHMWRKGHGVPGLQTP